jgi:hypothetical protein
MILIPVLSYEILVGFVLQRGVVLDEDRIANYIESIVSDNAAGAGNTATTTT